MRKVPRGQAKRIDFPTLPKTKKRARKPPPAKLARMPAKNRMTRTAPSGYALRAALVGGKATLPLAPGFPAAGAGSAALALRGKEVAAGARLLSSARPRPRWGNLYRRAEGYYEIQEDEIQVFKNPKTPKTMSKIARSSAKSQDRRSSGACLGVAALEMRFAFAREIGHRSHHTPIGEICAC